MPISTCAHSTDVPFQNYCTYIYLLANEISKNILWVLVYNFISKLVVHTFAPTFPPIQKPSLLLPHAYILPHSSCFYIILLFDFFLLNWVYYQLLNFLPIVSPSFFPMVPPSSQHHVFSPRRPLLPLKVSRSVAEPGI